MKFIVRTSRCIAASNCRLLTVENNAYQNSRLFRYIRMRNPVCPDSLLCYSHHRISPTTIIPLVMSFPSVFTGVQSTLSNYYQRGSSSILFLKRLTPADGVLLRNIDLCQIHCVSLCSSISNYCRADNFCYNVLQWL